MTESIKIRLAEEKDSDSLTEFNCAMARETENLDLPSDRLKQGIFAPFRDKHKGFYVVAADVDDHLVGGLMVTFEWSNWRNGWFWWITSVYIIPEARGNHIYRKLYEFVKKLAGDRDDVCGFRLYVDKANSNAREVYRRVGMEATNYLIYQEEIS